MSNRTILVLGGTGAMGGYLVNLIAEQDEVYVTSRTDWEDYKNVHYVKGNARDLTFLSEVLTRHYDVIVDFMNWGYEEFLHAHKMLLNATDHYMFLSSCRVFSNESDITETTPRLLDVSKDEDFLKTQRYALRKAREENMLTATGNTNYTIVRPYITFSDNRLQLGIYEKEQWLARALQRKKVYITKGVLDNYTTLTYGKDVAQYMVRLINYGPLASSINITTSASVRWRDVLSLYQRILKEDLGIELVVEERDDLADIENLYEGGYNTKYDRLWNRTFDNQKIKDLFGSACTFSEPLVSLEACFHAFLRNPGSVTSDKEFDSLMDLYEQGEE